VCQHCQRPFLVGKHIRIPCPQCGTQLKIQPKNFGKEGSCPRCNHLFRISKYMQMACPVCRRELHIQPDFVGERVKCNYCDQSFRATGPLDRSTVRGTLPPEWSGGADNQSVQQQLKWLQEQVRRLTSGRGAPSMSDVESDGFGPGATASRDNGIAPPAGMPTPLEEDEPEVRPEPAPDSANVDWLRNQIKDLESRAAEADELENQLRASREQIQRLQAELRRTDTIADQPDLLGAGAFAKELDAIRVQRDQLSEEVRQLRAELEARAAGDDRLGPLAAELESLRAERDALAASLAAATGDTEALQARLGQLEPVFAEAKAKGAAAEAALAQAVQEARARWEAEQQASVAQFQQDQQVLSRAQEQRFEGEKARIRAELKQAEQQLAEARKGLDQERGARADEVRQLREQVTNLQRQRDEAQARAGDLHRETQDLPQQWEAERTALRTQHQQEQQAQAQSLQQQAEQQLTAARQEFDHQRQQWEAERAPLLVQQHEREQAQQQLQALREEFDRERQSWQAERAAVATQRQQEQQAQARALEQRAQQQIAAARQEFDRERQALDEELARLRLEEQELVRHRDSLLAQHDDLQEHHQSQVRALQETGQQKSQRQIEEVRVQFGRERQALSEEIRRLRQDVEKTTKERAAALSQQEALRQQIRENAGKWEEERKALKDRWQQDLEEQLQRADQDARRQLDEVCQKSEKDRLSQAGDLQRLRLETEESARQRDAALARAAEVEHQRDEQQRTNQQADAERDRLEQLRRTLEADNQRLRRDLDNLARERSDAPRPNAPAAVGDEERKALETQYEQNLQVKVRSVEQRLIGEKDRLQLEKQQETAKLEAVRKELEAARTEFTQERQTLKAEVEKLNEIIRDHEKFRERILPQLERAWDKSDVAAAGDDRLTDLLNKLANVERERDAVAKQLRDRDESPPASPLWRRLVLGLVGLVLGLLVGLAMGFAIPH
jgi:hypothetical protein